MSWWRRRREQRVSYTNQPSRARTPVGESPEVKTMTQGATFRAGGLGFDETVGLASAAGILEAAAAGDVADRGLHAVGRRCARCDREFLVDTPVRRTTAGGWVHDFC